MIRTLQARSAARWIGPHGLRHTSWAGLAAAEKDSLVPRPSTTREQLLAAAQTHFAERGFAGAKLAEIADEIGATTGTFYGHFSSKSDLVVDLIASHDRAFLREISPQSSFQERCIAWWDTAVLHCGAQRAAHELMRGDSSVRELMRVSRERNGALLAQALGSSATHQEREFLGRLSIDIMSYPLIAGGPTFEDPSRPLAATVAQIVEQGLYPRAPESASDADPAPPTGGPGRLFITPAISWQPAPGRLAATSRRGSAQRDRIVACAAQVFGERGLGATTVEMIAARAGISAGTVYRYFEDKHDLFNLLLSAAEVDLYKQALMSVDEHGRLLVAEGASGHLRTRAAHQGVFRAWLELLGTNTPAADAWDRMNAQFRSALAAAVKRSQRSGLIAAQLEPNLVAEIVIALFYQSGTVRLDLGWEPDVSDNEFVRLVSKVLGTGF